MLSELSPQQIHSYETGWLIEMEKHGPTSQEDVALIKALKAYRIWRTSEKAQGNNPLQPPAGSGC